MNHFKKSFEITHTLSDTALANLLHIVSISSGKPLTVESVLKAYSPITNSVKLSNGMSPHGGLIANVKNANYRLQGLKSTYQTSKDAEFKKVFNELQKLNSNFENALYAYTEFVLKNFE